MPQHACTRPCITDSSSSGQRSRKLRHRYQLQPTQLMTTTCTVGECKCFTQTACVISKRCASAQYSIIYIKHEVVKMARDHLRWAITYAWICTTTIVCTSRMCYLLSCCESISHATYLCTIYISHSFPARCALPYRHLYTWSVFRYQHKQVTLLNRH